jgi:hypothetical protein
MSHNKSLNGFASREDLEAALNDVAMRSNPSHYTDFAEYMEKQYGRKMRIVKKWFYDGSCIWFQWQWEVVPVGAANDRP